MSRLPHPLCLHWPRLVAPAVSVSEWAGQGQQRGWDQLGW